MARTQQVKVTSEETKAEILKKSVLSESVPINPVGKATDMKKRFVAPIVDADGKSAIGEIDRVAQETEAAFLEVDADITRLFGASTTAYATNEAQGKAIQDLQNGKVNKSGDTMTGNLRLVGSDGTMTITNKGFERSGVLFELPSGEYGKLVSDRQAITDLTFHIEEDTFAMVLAAYNGRGDIVYVKQIDLPIESMVVGGAYNDITHRIELTLQNGNIVSFPVDELVNGLISSSEKGQPNGVAILDAEGKVPKEQLPDDIGGGGSGGESVDLSEYLKTVDLANAMVSEFNTPTKTLTDEEKTSACEWLGAVEKVKSTSGSNRLYGVKSGTTETTTYTMQDKATAYSVALRGANGVLAVGDAVNASDAVNLGQLEAFIAQLKADNNLV